MLVLLLTVDIYDIESLIKTLNDRCLVSPPAIIIRGHRDIITPASVTRILI